LSFVSQETDADVVAAVLSDGAKGYVQKQNAISELPSAVEAVLQGDRFVSEGLISETNPPASSCCISRAFL
jgi:DNA-binding NarL/FixJ family response regulator